MCNVPIARPHMGSCKRIPFVADAMVNCNHGHGDMALVNCQCLCLFPYKKHNLRNRHKIPKCCLVTFLN